MLTTIESNKISVFISYAREDFIIAKSFENAINSRNISVWMDKEIRPLDYWKEEINNAIISSDYIIYIVSKNSTVFDCYCRREIQFALENNKVIIPIQINNFSDINLNFIPNKIRELHWVDFSTLVSFKDENNISLDSWNVGSSQKISQIIEIFNTDPIWRKTHTKLLEKAQEWNNHNRDNSYLLIGSELDYFSQAQITFHQEEPKLTLLQNEFQNASILYQTVQINKQKRINRRQKIMLFSLCILLIILTSTSIIIRRQTIKILTEYLAKESILLNNDIDTSILLSIQANNLSEEPEIRSSLFEELNENRNVVKILRLPTPINN